jgi:diguanylate cyclase (GGDEF)-like protein
VPKASLSVKIIIVITLLCAFASFIFGELLTQVVTAQEEQALNKNLIHYINNTKDSFEAEFLSYSRKMERIAVLIEAENTTYKNKSVDHIDDYWNDKKAFLDGLENTFADGLSSVFINNKVIVDPKIKREIASTKTVWSFLGEHLDPNFLSLSYISNSGFVRTQPGHRVNDFAKDIDMQQQTRFYQLAQATEEARSWGIDYDPVNNFHVLILTQKVKIAGVQVGVLGAVYKLSINLKFDLERLTTHSEFGLLLMDTDQMLLANPIVLPDENSSVAVFEQLHRLINKADIEQSHNGLVQSVSVNNENYHVTNVDLPSMQWVLVAYYPASLLVDQANEFRTSLFIVLAMSLMVLAIATYLSLYFGVIKPLQKLTFDAEQMPERNWKFVSPVSSDDEVGFLGHAIERMSNKIRLALSDTRRTIRSLDNLHQSLDQLNLIVDNSQALVAVIDLDWNISYTNKHFMNLFGEGLLGSPFDDCYFDKFDQESAISSVISAMLKEQDEWNVEIKTPERVIPVLDLIQTVVKQFDDEGQLVSYIYTASNNYQNNKHTEAMEMLAYYDHLTGLQNRTYFKNQLSKELSTAKRENRIVAILYLDLDNFKTINDSLGHEAGDQMLIATADRLRKCLNEEDAIGRLDSDEFAILLNGFETLHYASIVANKVIRVLNQPVYIEGQSLSLQASIGIAVSPQDGEDANTLMKNADVAMHEAKGKGKNSFRFFTNDMDKNVANRIQLEHDIQAAFESQEFVLFYQPQVDVLTGEVKSAEALARWRLPDGTIRSPFEFMDVIENSDFIIPFGLWVFRTGCQQAKTLYKSLRRRIVISINVSPRQLSDPGFIGAVKDVIREVGVDPTLIEVEITESLFMDNLDQTIKDLQALRDIGFRISVDDFGTGYSSLSYLKRLPIDQLKIDRSFIIDLPDDEEGCVITELIATMAQRLSLEIVAEGVETKEQFRYLKNINCDLIQGYLFSRPLPDDQFMVFVFNSGQQAIFDEVN